ncbi:BnaA03g60300D [Brassica napus]|uniref:BnaA03g60300D protein n=1 Tax=Brassica napus TaxID=3708 RepID=A0A078GM98_BRANA|nr:BnaA03g60300D [Brassica napus]
MIQVSVSPSSAPIDPGGAEEGKISDRENQIWNGELEVKLQASSVPESIPASRVPSYAARLKSSLRNLHKVSDPTFLDDSTPVVQAPESVLLETSKLWKDHIVAHFHGYWQVDRCAFSVYPWSADGNLAAQELLFAPTWAVLKNVPPQLYSLKGISVVASGIGEPLHTENSRLDPYHFGDTKVKVEIDLAHTPLEVVEVRGT